jgi:hypothetical protein
MSDTIERICKDLYNYAEKKHFNGEVELANGILKAKCYIEDEKEKYEELAKEPHEFKMRDATAEEQKYTQAKIDKIKEPQKCEWNRQGAEDFIITGCGHRPYKVIIDNCGFKIDFCPYCGRKIKVIE